MNLCLIEASKDEISFKSVAERVNVNQGFQVSNHGSKLVMGNVSCNFFDLYVGLLKKLKEDFKLIGHGVGSEVNVSILGQVE